MNSESGCKSDWFRLRFSCHLILTSWHLQHFATIGSNSVLDRASHKAHAGWPESQDGAFDMGPWSKFHTSKSRPEVHSHSTTGRNQACFQIFPELEPARLAHFLKIGTRTFVPGALGFKEVLCFIATFCATTYPGPFSSDSAWNMKHHCTHCNMTWLYGAKLII